MSADIIAFPSRRDIVMREASSPDKLERAFRESERFIENLYRNLDRVSPEELASRRRALAAAWEAAVPTGLAHTRLKEHGLYQRQWMDFFRNCVARGTDPQVVAKALLVNGGHRGDINTAFIDIGDGDPYGAFETALAGRWPARPPTHDSAFTAS